MLLLAAPSWAGHWAFVFNGTGTMTSPSGTLACTIKDSVVTNAAPLNSYAPPLVSVSSSSLGMGGSPYGGSPSLTVTAKLVWMPDAPQDTSLPPPTVDVLVTGSAACSQYLVNPTGLVVHADDGLQDSPTSLVAPMYGQTSTGKHLVHLTVSAGQTSVALPGGAVTLSSSVSCTASQGGNGSPGMGVSYAVQIDSRMVTIVGGRSTFKKVLSGGVDANGDGLWQQVPNQFINGTLSDDIAIPFGEKHNEVISGSLVPVDSTTKLSSTYLPGLFGNWATEGAQYLLNTSAKNYNLQGALGSAFVDTPPTAADIPEFTNTFVGPTVDDTNSGAIIWNDAGVTDHVFFKFTNGDNRHMNPTAYPTGNDGDGAIASANYYLNIHHPIESFPSHAPAMTVYRIATAYPVSGTNPLTGEADIPMTIDAPGYATYGTDGTNGLAATVHLNNPSVGWALSANVASLLSNIPYPGYLVALDVVFNGASIAINYYRPAATTYPVAWSVGAWTDPWSTGQGTGSKSDYRMFPRIRVRYTRTYTLVDTYDMSGFQTEGMSHSDKFVQNDSSFGYFQYIGATK